MTALLPWFRPEFTHALGWTLLHFMWEGAALVLLLSAMLARMKNPCLRCRCAVAILACMIIMPVVTFVLLQRPSTAHHSLPPSVTEALGTVKEMAVRTAADTALPPAALTTVDWLGCFVSAWFGGVLVLGGRALGGWIILKRLHNNQHAPLESDWLQTCLALQRRLQLKRAVRYCRSPLVDSPSVTGWLRPVVLLPVSALTDLSPAQLRAIIVHELAHLQRRDQFVNLFQILAETLLFYHPAVWWASRMIRAEREHCCDDIAVSVCGNAGEYAKALAVLETARVTSVWALAARGGALTSRIRRLLGLQVITPRVPAAGLAIIGLVCATGIFLAGTGFPAAGSPSGGFARLVLPTEKQNEPPTVAEPSAAPRRQRARRTPPIAATSTTSALPVPASEDSYIGQLSSVGLSGLTVEQLIQLKVQGVTPAYVRDLQTAGLSPGVHDLIALRVQGVTAEYVRQMHDIGFGPSVHELIGMKVQGVDPEYVRAIRATGLSASAHELIALRVQGVTPELIQKLHRQGLQNLTVHQLIALKAAGIF